MRSNGFKSMNREQERLEEDTERKKLREEDEDRKEETVKQREKK